VNPTHAEKALMYRILQILIAREVKGMLVLKVTLSFKDPVLTPVVKAGETRRKMPGVFCATLNLGYLLTSLCIHDDDFASTRASSRTREYSVGTSGREKGNDFPIVFKVNDSEMEFRLVLRVTRKEVNEV
jgi:hypothetical protein